MLSVNFKTYIQHPFFLLYCMRWTNAAMFTLCPKPKLDIAWDPQNQNYIRFASTSANTGAGPSHWPFPSLSFMVCFFVVTTHFGTVQMPPSLSH